MYETVKKATRWFKEHSPATILTYKITTLYLCIHFLAFTLFSQYILDMHKVYFWIAAAGLILYSLFYPFFLYFLYRLAGAANTLDKIENKNKNPDHDSPPIVNPTILRNKNGQVFFQNPDTGWYDTRLQMTPDLMKETIQLSDELDGKVDDVIVKGITLLHLHVKAKHTQTDNILKTRDVYNYFNTEEKP